MRSITASARSTRKMNEYITNVFQSCAYLILSTKNGCNPSTTLNNSQGADGADGADDVDADDDDGEEEDIVGG